MTVRGLWVAVLLVISGGLAAWANVAPTMADQYVATVQNMPVTFELRAEDGDIDPLDSTSEQLAFVVLEGPSHGILIGDLADVLYAEPHYGIVELTYTAADGYVGTDVVVVSVTDLHGEAASGTTTIEIDVAPRRSEGLLSGNWNTEVTFNVQSAEITVFRTQLTEIYRLDRFAVKGIVDLKMETVGASKTFVFDALRVITDVTLGGFAIGSTLEFDPDAPGPSANLFDYWRTTTDFVFLGVDFTHTLYLTRPQTASYQTIAMQGGFNGVSISDTVRIGFDGDCSLVLARNDAVLSWSWCDVDLRASLAVTCAGFEKAVFAAAGIPVPSVGLLPEDVTLDFAVTFELERKSFSAELDWSPDWLGCIRLMAELESTTVVHPAGSSETVTGIVIYGLKLECEIPPGVSFVSATSFDRNYNSKVTGWTDYFEVIRLAGDLVGCCGVPGYWGISTYFYSSSSLLFDWGMTIASFDLGLSDQLSFSLDVAIHSGELTLSAPWTEISVGWTVRW